MPHMEVAIVGMGVLGRKLFRELIDVDTGNFRLNWNILCIVDPNAPSEIAYLINHDTVYGNIKNVATSNMPIRGDDNAKMYDYCGCLYPEGVVSSDKNLLFDHNQIAKIYALGYSDDEEKNFKVKLKEVLANK